MYAMELTENSIVALEIVAPLLLLIVICLSSLLKMEQIRWIIFSLVAVQLIGISFRSPTYNSDTWNYYNYIETIAETALVDSFWVSKFEPLHLGLALITQNFRYWLILESFIAIFFFKILIWRIHRIETLAIVIGCALPLMSSSLRFAVGLLGVACALIVFHQATFRFFFITFTGAMTHASLMVAGIFQRRKWFELVFLPIFFLAWVWFDQSIIFRLGIEDDREVRATGFRTFICFSILVFYLSYCNSTYRKNILLHDLLLGVIVLSLSLTVSPVANRWLILLMVTIAVNADQTFHSVKASRKIGSVIAAILYFVLLAPFLYSILDQVYRGEWSVACVTRPILNSVIFT
jgi:hypothetical protein